MRLDSSLPNTPFSHTSSSFFRAGQRVSLHHHSPHCQAPPKNKMTTAPDPKYSKMLSTPAPLVTLISTFAETHGLGCSLERPRKDRIAPIQKQIDFHIAEAYRLRSIRNSHVAISQLPAELLSDVFLYIVETGLRWDHMSFNFGTFAFLQVCRRWNEVAVESPQLWVWWIPGTLEVWNRFKSRSKDAPLFLTWRNWLPKYALDILTDTETPRRIRQLWVDGTHEQLGQILGGLDSRSTPTTSSVRLQCDHNEESNEEHLTRFFSLPFPKLSKLYIGTFPPDPTSSILTTSNLTSLKLNLTYNDSRCYNRSQLSQVLQQHPNLKQLDLRAGGLSLVENSGEPVPIVLPRLVDLKLCGTDEGIDGFIDLISMSSPLYSVETNRRVSETILSDWKELIFKYLTDVLVRQL